MQTKSVAVLLILLVAGGEASKVAVASLGQQLLGIDKSFGLGDTAIVNEYVDTTVPLMVDFIVRHDLDPMPLPDIEEGFDYRPLLITYRGELTLRNGHLENLSSVYRNGDAVVSYFAKMLRIRLELAFKDLEFGYNYRAKLMDIGPTGRIVGSLSHINVEVDVLVDFNNDEVHLQHFTFSEIGRLRVRLSGNFLTDWFMNPVIALFTTLLNTTIIGFVEATIRTTLDYAIADLNRFIKGVMDGLV